MPNPWKEPEALAKLLDIQPGQARELMREQPDALRQARAAKRNGLDPRTILPTKTDHPPAQEERDATTIVAPGEHDNLQAVKAIYEGYNIQDINTIVECIELVGGVEQFHKTKELLEGGWLHSGDAGYLDKNGHLVVIDRLSDVMHNRDGAMFSPMFLENKLKFSLKR